MDELISVIILTYNQEKYIQDTIRSVIDQDYPYLELVILDDCSTDSTEKKIYEMNEELRKRFVRFVFIKNKNNTGNMSKNCNTLLNELHGEYFKILGGDDMLTSDSCKKSLEVLIKNGIKYDVVFSDAYIIGPEHNYLDIRTNTGDYQKIKNSNDGESNVVNHLLFCNPFICIGALCRTNSVREVGGYDERTIIEDYQMWIRMALKGKRFAVTHEPLAFYRRTDSSISNLLPLDNQRREKISKFTYQVFKTISIFEEELNEIDFKKAMIHKVIWTMTNQCMYGEVDPVEINGFLHEVGSTLDATDVWSRLKEKCRKWGENYRKIVIYGYGKYGRFFVYLMDASKTRYSQIVDLGYQNICDSRHTICGLHEIQSDTDCVIITPLEYYNEICHTLAERGIGKTIGIKQFLNEFAEEYVLGM